MINNNKINHQDITLLIWLAIPLILSGLIESSIGFFSTLFLAKLGQEALAAGALVNWLFVTLMVVLWGTLTAMSIWVSQKQGEKDQMSIARLLRDGLLLAVLLVLPTFVLLWNISPLLLLAGQNPATVLLAESYLHALSWGLLPDFVMLVLLQFLIGLGHTRTSMFFTLFWVPISIFCNYILVFGKWGFPQLGIAGIGWGMTLSYWLTTGFLILYLLFHPAYRTYFNHLFVLDKPFFILKLLKVGVPIGAMYCIEIGFFLALTLCMGKLEDAALAANQIVLQYLGQLTAVVFAIAQAITVRMGHLLGAKDHSGAHRASFAGILIAASFMVVIALIYWIVPQYLIEIDLNLTDPNNKKIIDYAIQFFFIAAIFQLLESIRIALFGALRALKDTHFTLLVSIFGFWCMALPIGLLLSHYFKLGGIGLWWGMVIGAASGVLLLYCRLKYKFSRLSYAT